MDQDNALLIIPARAGSMGVYRKNVRSVGGHPLIGYGLSKARHLQSILYAELGVSLHVVVATDDPEVAVRARVDGDAFNGLLVVDRPNASPVETIAEMLSDVVDRLPGLADDWPKQWEWIGVHQLTSPTLLVGTMAQMIGEFVEDPSIDSMATMTIDTALRWNDNGPMAAERANRQYSDDVQYRETGGLHLVRDYPRTDGWYGANCLTIGERHTPFLLAHDEAIDIDTPADLAAAEMILTWPKVSILTAGDAVMGTGHIRRADGLAAALSPYADVSVEFIGTSAEMRAMVGERNRGTNRTGDFGELWATSDLVVVDMLDRNQAMVREFSLKFPDRTIFLESDGIGDGSICVNGLYDTPTDTSGVDWIDIRDEFRDMGYYYEVREECSRVLISFGGSDPARCSASVANRIVDLGLGLDVSIVDPPFGPVQPGEVDHERIAVLENPSMVEEMIRHDILITSRGRTTHEAATVGIPTISFAVNERERDRNHAPPGTFAAVPHEGFLDPSSETFAEEVGNAVGVALAGFLPMEVRYAMSTTARSGIDGHGLDRIRDLVLAMARENKRCDGGE